MQTLNPAETFTINRILRDHTDTTTYYVQAKVYDSTTRALIDTKSLTDNGSRWFSAAYRAPYDNTFNAGRRILIVTSVYTDSGYTTKSSNHGDEPEEYLIQQRWSQSMTFGGGGGSVDETVLKRIIKEAIDGIKFPEQKEVIIPKVDIPVAVDITPVLNEAVSKIVSKIDSINLPEPEKVDLSPVLASIKEVSKQLVVTVPKFEKADVVPLLQEVRGFSKQVSENHKEFIELAKQTFKDTKLKLIIDNAGNIVDTPEEIKKSKKDRFLTQLAARYQ